MQEKLQITIASAFGAGFAPFAPGTWGTLVGSIILALMWQGGLTDTGWPLLIFTFLVSLLGYWSINHLPKSWKHDDQRIVVDEVVGLFTTMIFIPITWKTIVLSFILFRVFDIWKPLGIRKFDNLHSNASVIVDDLVAGVYANFTLRGLILLLTAYGYW